MRNIAIGVKISRKTEINKLSTLCSNRYFDKMNSRRLWILVVIDKCSNRITER